MISIAPKTDGKTANGVHTALSSLKKIEKIKIILTIRKGHGILTKLFRTTEMIEADSKKEK